MPKTLAELKPGRRIDQARELLAQYESLEHKSGNAIQWLQSHLRIRLTEARRLFCQVTGELANVQAGDEVAMQTGKRIDIVKVAKLTPSQVVTQDGRRFYFTGFEVGRGSTRLTLATAELRALAEEQARRRREDACARQEWEAADRRIASTPEMQAIDKITSAFSEDFVSLEDRYALAQRIGLPVLESFAAAVRAAKGE